MGLHATILKGHCCNIVLSAHNPTDNKSDDTNNIYKELEHVFEESPMYQKTFC
jgi:hypothetical protein